MNKKGQALWEFALTGFVIAACVAGYLIWTDAHKQTQTNTFQPDSKQVTTADKKFALVNDISISLGNWHFGGAAKPTATTVAVPPAVKEPVQAVVVTPTEVSAPVVTAPVNESLKIGHVTGFERFGVDLIIILVVMALGGLLDAIGGDCIIELRRYAMPVLLAIGTATVIFTFYPEWWAWLYILAVLPMCGTLTLPYAGDGNFGRGMWLFVQGVTGGLFLAVIPPFFHLHLLAWYLYVFYAIVTGIWGGVYRLWDQFFGDWITGSLGLCTLIFYVYLTLQFGL